MIGRALLAALVMTQASGCALYCSNYASSGCLTPEEIRSNGSNHTALVDWLEFDERSWVREEAARTLGNVKDREALEVLTKRALDGKERPYVRAAAVEALGAIADPLSLTVLQGIAANPAAPPELHIAVVLAACRFEGPEGLQLIAPLAKHGDLLVSSAALNSLASNCGRPR